MPTPDAFNSGSPETQERTEAVSGIIDRSRKGIDDATEGACGIVSVLGAGGRFIAKPIATAVGEVWRSARETLEAGRETAGRGRSSKDTSNSTAA